MAQHLVVPPPPPEMVTVPFSVYASYICLYVPSGYLT